MKRQTLIIATLVLGMGFVSCKKEGCTDATATNYNESADTDDGSCTYETPTATTPGTYTPTFTGEFAALIAIKTVSTTSTPIGPFDLEVGASVAFFSENGGNSFVNAGTVNTDGNSLSIQDNNTYLYMLNQSEPNGLTFGSTVNWGGTGSTWQAFSASTTQGFTTLTEITSGDVSTSSSYTLQANTITNADSILYAVYGPTSSKTIIVAGSNTSHTFSAADLSGIGTGSGFVQIVGLNYDPQTIGGKQYWLLNETVRTKQVTIN